MPDKAVISHRGEKYEIGRGKRFYGIWVVGAPYDAPVDRWPENRDGWQQAWARFAAIEVPGTITPVTSARKGLRLSLGRRKADAGAPGAGAAGLTALAGLARPRSRAGTGLLVGEGLLVLGVVLGLAGLFPDYEGGQSLLSQWDQVVPHLCYVIGWGVTAALVALSVARPSGSARLGALFGLGLSAVTFGLFLSDLGEVISGEKLGSGLIVSLLGWAACTAGAALAFTANAGPAGPRDLLSRPVRPGRWHAGPLALLVLAGIGTAAAFAPAWDSYVITAASAGVSQTLTEGNAFDPGPGVANPGVLIAGNVAVMVAIVAVTVLAALWRPARHGALLLAGAIVPLAADFVSALIQIGQPATPAMFGISSAQASAEGITVSSGPTGIFWVYLVFVIALLVSCAWLFTEPGHPVMRGFQTSPWQPVGGDPGTPDAAGAAVSEDADSDASEDADSDRVDSGTEAADSDTGTGDGEQSAYA
ncbi:MAG TPA: hypothetical protein VGG83_01245 [Trebonia sp.]